MNDESLRRARKIWPTWMQVFNLSSGALLAITGLIKLISGFGHVPVLDAPEPVFDIPFRQVLLLAGVVEMGTALVCWFSKEPRPPAVLVAWLAGSLIVYRLGLLLIGYHGMCPCLGTLSDTVHIPPWVADLAMKVILIYLSLGSSGSLLWCSRHSRRPTDSDFGVGGVRA